MQFLYPVPLGSVVIQSYAAHVHRAAVNNWQHYNGGIDWSVPTGTPIRAAQAGLVVAAMHDAAGYGVYVRIQHADGYETLYAHLMDYSVEVNQTVEAGDVIARSDSTGITSEPNLHFEIRLNEEAIDPAPLLVAALPGETDAGTRGLERAAALPDAPPPRAGKAPKRWPKLPRLQVISLLGVNIHQWPDHNTPVVGYLPCETEFEALRQVTRGEDTWLQIGHNQYVAMTLNETALVAWV